MLPLTPGCLSCRDLKDRLAGCQKSCANERNVGHLEGLEEALIILNSGGNVESIRDAVGRTLRTIQAKAVR
jgi:hypothetical protein